MSDLDPELVRRTARLAGLDLSEAEEGGVGREFERILGAFRRLTEVDVTGVAPLHAPSGKPGGIPGGEPGPRELRADLEREGGEGVDPASLLERAPDPREGFFGVPRTLGEDPGASS